METKKLEEVMAKVDQAKELDENLFTQAVLAMKAAFPSERFEHAASLFKNDPTEAVLHLIEERLPDWQISLKGKGHDVGGEWGCTIRESSSLDDDEVVGIGSGRTLSLAVLAAILRAGIWRINQR
jgi:hypothetical protein